MKKEIIYHFSLNDRERNIVYCALSFYLKKLRDLEVCSSLPVECRDLMESFSKFENSK